MSGPKLSSYWALTDPSMLMRALAAPNGLYGALAKPRPHQPIPGPPGNPEATPECDAHLDWECFEEATWLNAADCVWQHTDGRWGEQVISLNEQRMIVALDGAWSKP